MSLRGKKRNRHWWITAKVHLRGLLGLNREESARFENMKAYNAFKFELAYPIVLLSGALIYGCLSRTFSKGLSLTQPEKDCLFAPALGGVCIRCLTLLVRGRLWRRGISPHLLATFCFFVDVGFLTWYEPHDDNLFCMTNTSIFDLAAPDLLAGDIGDLTRSLQKQCLAQIQAIDQQMLDDEFATREERFDEDMVFYSLQVLFWYMTAFVLLFRHVCIAVPLSVVIYYCGSYRAWRKSTCIEEYWLEMLFVFLSTIALILAKAYIEVSQREMFALLESKSQEVINERALPFQLQFEHELKSKEFEGRQHSEAGLESASCSSASIIEPLNGHRRFVQSVRSAPAALVSHKLGGCATETSGDCLPPGALVWVEGKNTPQVVNKLEVGQRVLCHDHIERALKYVELVEVGSLCGKVPWVDVHLLDGTVLTVTAKHPLVPRDENVQARDIRDCVAAANLVPGQSLMTYRMAPVSIVKVCELDMSSQVQRGLDDRRVALSVMQPARFEIFAATVYRGDARAVAVGSASLPSGIVNENEGPHYTVKRTFIEVHTPNNSNRRAFSEPGSFRYSGRIDLLPAGRSFDRLQSKMSAWSDPAITENSSCLQDSISSKETCEVLVASSSGGKVARSSQLLEAEAGHRGLGSVEPHPKKHRHRKPGNIRRAMKRERRNDDPVQAL